MKQLNKKFDDLTDYAETLYRQCMLNSYFLLTKKKSFSSLVSGESPWFTFNSLDDFIDNRNKYIDETIKYFEEVEEYEKCNELLKIKDEELVE